jgi:Rod binding domain-containing protein
MISSSMVPTGAAQVAALQSAASAAPPQNPELRETFDAFVGEMFFTQMMKSMRQTVGEPAYFHGGQAEKMLTSQLDQVLAEQMSKASASSFTGPMFELFSLQRG